MNIDYITVSSIELFSPGQVNSNDNDGGVLVGNWSGEYSAGISPTMWIGSQAIFEKYLEDDAGVQFGQCWVFSALVTSCKYIIIT